jgi:hypothetical protein
MTTTLEPALEYKSQEAEMPSSQSAPAKTIERNPGPGARRQGG